MARLILILFAGCVPLSAQSFGVGLRGGVPLSDAFKLRGLPDSSQGFTFGPTAELRLPLGLSVGAEALYKRSSQGESAWEFPILGRLRAPGGLLRPFVEAGPTFQRVSLISQSRAGFALGGGLEIKLPIVRIQPGLRYSRFGSQGAALPSANAVDFLVGISF
jgi:hypothetical protein